MIGTKLDAWETGLSKRWVKVACPLISLGAM
jgi:hypothetical protein